MSLYAIKMLDGSVSIMNLIDESSTPQAEIDRWPAEKAAKVVSVRQVDRRDIPTDRHFRNAWTDDNMVVEVDMIKARPIHMEELRRIRNEKLQELDIEFMKVLGQGGDITSIEAQKQVLRDIPQTVDLDIIDTPDALKRYLPQELK